MSNHICSVLRHERRVRLLSGEVTPHQEAPCIWVVAFYLLIDIKQNGTDMVLLKEEASNLHQANLLPPFLKVNSEHICKQSENFFKSLLLKGAPV